VDTTVDRSNVASDDTLTARARSWAPVVATSLLLLAVVATWFGYLDAKGHPTLKIWMSMLIAVWGLGTVLLVRGIRGGEGEALPDVTGTTLGLLSMAAAAIHFAVVEQHITLYWAYGWFFIVVGVAQLVWAVAVVLRPTRLLLIAGAVGNALVAIAWVVTRTYGAVIGPDATEPDKVGFGDVLSTIFEVAIVVGAIALVAWGASRRPGRSRAGDLASGFVALVVLAFTVLGLYSAVGGTPFVSHVG
jgi:hypothetical protein